MKKAAIIGLAAMLGLTATTVLAKDFKVGNLVISNPSVRLTIPSRPGAGFMTVRNLGDTPDSIISAHSSAAKRIEIHSSMITNGIMKMRPVKKVVIPAKSQVAFKSGGLHLMIFGLKSAEVIPITVVFAKAGALKISAPVKSMLKKKKSN